MEASTDALLRIDRAICCFAKLIYVFFCSIFLVWFLFSVLAPFSFILLFLLLSNFQLNQTKFCFFFLLPDRKKNLLFLYIWNQYNIELNCFICLDFFVARNQIFAWKTEKKNSLSRTHENSKSIMKRNVHKKILLHLRFPQSNIVQTREHTRPICVCLQWVFIQYKESIAKW